MPTGRRAQYRNRAFAELEQLFGLIAHTRVGLRELQLLLSVAGGEVAEGLRGVIFDLRAGRIGSTRAARQRLTRSGKPQGGHVALPEAMQRPKRRALTLPEFQRVMFSRFYLRPDSSTYELEQVPLSLLRVTLQRRRKLGHFHAAWEERVALGRDDEPAPSEQSEEAPDEDDEDEACEEAPEQQQQQQQQQTQENQQARRPTRRRAGIMVDVFLWHFNEAAREAALTKVAAGKAVRTLRACGECFVMTDVFGDAEAVSGDRSGPVTRLLFPKEHGELELEARPVEWAWGSAVRNLAAHRDHAVLATRDHVYAWALRDEGRSGHAAVDVPFREGLRAPTAADAARLREGGFLVPSAFVQAKRAFGAVAHAAADEWGSALRGGPNREAERALERRVADAWDAMLVAAGPRLVPGLDGVLVTSVACGPAHSAVVARSGALFTWGQRDNGRLGHPGAGVARVELPAAARQVACGNSHTVALLDGGAVFVWGGNQFGQLGIGARRHSYDDVAQPEGVPLPAPAAQVLSGGDHTVVRTEAGDVFAAGANWSGEAGQPQEHALVHAFARIPLPRGAVAAHAAASEDATVVLTADDRVFASGVCALPSAFAGVGERRSVFRPTEVPIGAAVGRGSLRQVACGVGGAVVVTVSYDS